MTHYELPLVLVHPVMIDGVDRDRAEAAPLARWGLVVHHRDAKSRFVELPVGDTCHTEAGLPGTSLGPGSMSWEIEPWFCTAIARANEKSGAQTPMTSPWSLPTLVPYRLLALS